MNLIIVESPTKARTLSRFLNEDYLIEPTMGHILDLPKSKFGIDIQNDFKPEYVILDGRKKNIEAICQLAKKAEKIFLATDPDREGEAIAWHIYSILSGKVRFKGKQALWTFDGSMANLNSLIKRIVFHEITQQAVRDALAKPYDVDMRLVDAQTARRVLDRVVGYKLSPLLWKKIRRGLSAGRVQSVAVRLIVEREREIEKFKPQEYWEIFCEVKSQNKEDESFLIKLILINEQRADIKNQQEAEKIVGELEKAYYKIKKIELEEIRKPPLAPFTTSTLSQKAARLYFWSSQKTMSVAQRLYEKGLITYHRTDSTNLAKEAILSCRSFIEDKYGKQFLPPSPRIYKTKSRVAQEAHEAIRPTNVRSEQDQNLDKDEKMLYGLIWKRFVASQMSDAVFEQTRIEVEARNESVYRLEAVGQVMKFEGWKKVYNRDDYAGQVFLPVLHEGENLNLLKVNSAQNFTQPPARFTEASLIKTLEKYGIGRPSTYAPIISTIQKRQYVEKIEGKFHPTPIGIAVNDFLMRYFTDIVDYKFTAVMEDDLDKIANGQLQWIPVMKKFWQPFFDKLNEVEKNSERVKIEVEETSLICPKCKTGKQVIRTGRFGKFLSCSRFPECDWKEKFVETLETACPECKIGKVVIKKNRRNKRFYGCSRYPDCKWASWKLPKAEKG